MTTRGRRAPRTGPSVTEQAARQAGPYRSGMDLLEAWPLFGLRLLTPRLELRPVRDEDLPGLVDAALAGIHHPAVMPFAVPWTDAEPDVLRRELARFVWRQRASIRPGTWTLQLAVLRDGPFSFRPLPAARRPPDPRAS